ncbi:carboxylesterase family protein [Clostridium hydrogenum]|uniref:carboxylesterase family protein n=1 Tax=Clostridium hydrogenum TaxID=2855764 RepID=UPI001F3251A9|nr:carboxylesterase family protein [Clostridium hydrogenum]
MIETDIVNTTGGKVQGFVSDVYEIFLGVPFAKAKRFCPPEEINWEGTFRAVHYGPRCWQAPRKMQSISKEKFNMSDDCLNMNIFTPSIKGKLPIVVDIYGGAFQNGGADKKIKTGVGLLKGEQFVYVGFNYRVGVWGYLYLGKKLGDKYKTSGNNGTLDQIAALKWIYNNAAAFGGDRDRITVIGESAGAKSIGALMVAKESKNLFHSAVLSSGGIQSIRDTNTAHEITKRFLKILKLNNIEDILTVDNDILTKANEEFCSSGVSTCYFGPVADDIVIPTDWHEDIKSENGWKGKAVIGCNKNECGWYSYFAQDEEFNTIAKQLFGDNAVYAENEFSKIASDIDEKERIQKKCDILSDYMYRTHTYKLADTLIERGLTVWQYSYELPPALHALDMMALWEEEVPEMLIKILSQEQLKKSGDILRDMYVGFAINGEPKFTSKWLPSTKEQKYVFRINEAAKVEKLNGSDALMDFPEEAILLK